MSCGRGRSSSRRSEAEAWEGVSSDRTYAVEDSPCTVEKALENKRVRVMGIFSVRGFESDMSSVLTPGL